MALTKAPRKTTQATDDFDSTPARLYSLDALRGFDMFWIMGADEIMHALRDSTKSSFWTVIGNQFEHPDWNGFHAYDMIFPLFLFMAGVSTPFSVGRELEKGKSREQLLGRVIKRAFILVLLGLLVNNGLNKSTPDNNPGSGRFRLHPCPPLFVRCPPGF